MSYQDKNLTCPDCSQYPSLWVVMPTGRTGASSRPATVPAP